MAAITLDAEITTLNLNEALSLGSLNLAPAKLWAAGPTRLLDGEKTGFFCSSQCPGGVILKTFDAITAMREQGRTLREQESVRLISQILLRKLTAVGRAAWRPTT